MQKRWGKNIWKRCRKKMRIKCGKDTKKMWKKCGKDDVKQLAR